MEQLVSNAATQVNQIMLQISALNWVLILSGVGVVEGIAKKNRRLGVQKKGDWVIPIIIGLLIGVVSYIAKNGISYAGIVQYVMKVFESALAYCGWVTFSYYFTLRPIKYAGDWIKRKSEGPKKEA